MSDDPTAASSPHVEHVEDFVLFRRAPRLGRWSSLISRLLNNENPKNALDGNLELLKELLKDVREVFDSETVVINLTVKEDDRLVLVGDIHGQFRDLQTHILSPQRENVSPSTSSPRATSSSSSPGATGSTTKKDDMYLFLGDYVDRGPHGVEVIMLLFALKVEYPENIFLIRGNHEEIQTCRMYGFLQECKAKLDFPSFSVFAQTFCHIPLAATVTCSAGSIFCAHGGLSPHTVAIEALMFINRLEYGETMDSSEEGEIVDGLLWSDPCERPGYKQNMRGCGFTFGADATEAFCQQNDVQFICRAHQMVMEGFQWDHDNRLLTIFSAPNYCGINNNKGAIAILDGTKQKKGERIHLDMMAYESAPASPCMLYGRSPGVEGTAVAHFFSPSPPQNALDPPVPAPEQATEATS